MQTDTTVYVVDPDLAIRQALIALLGTYNVQVRAFSDAESFLETALGADLNNSCMILEADLPGLNGVLLLKKLRKLGFNLPAIILVNSANQDLHLQALKQGATDVLEKPLISALLIERLVEFLTNSASPVIDK